MECRQIIMNYSVPPSLDDIGVLVHAAWESLPGDLLLHCAELAIVVEELVDEVTQRDLDLGDAYDLLALYKNGGEISPAIERKVSDDDDSFVLYRRPLLDLWRETGDDLQSLIKQVVIEELGRHFEFSDVDIQEMVERHCQG